ncbi:MAG: phage portal protein [Fimbriimonadaceae bacterium]|nr:phage portal protein [Fimbriimonadaceae bacterium]
MASSLTRWWQRRRTARETAPPAGRLAGEQLAYAASDRRQGAEPALLEYEAAYASCDDVYAAVSLLADNAAMVPLRVLVAGQAAPEHPLQRLLDRANPQQGAKQFWIRAYAQLWLTGETYLVVERQHPLDADRPSELWAFSGRVMEPLPDPQQYLRGYRFRPPGTAGDGVELAPRDVVPVLLFHPTRPLRGLSPLTALRLGLATELHAKRANHDLFRNGLLTDVAISFDFASDEQRQRTREALRQAHAADGRRHGILVLENSTRVEKLSLSPRDAEFLELDKLTTRDVAKAYRIPPMFLAQLDHATLRNYETAYRALWELAILPRVGQMATALTEHLAAQYGPTVTVEPDLSGIEVLRAADRERAATYGALVAAGLAPQWAGQRVFGSGWSAAALAAGEVGR